MAGIESIVQRLIKERDDRITERSEKVAMLYQELSVDIDAMNFMIEAGQARMNGHVVPVNHDEQASTRPRLNPFLAGIIRWHCFEVLKGATEPMHINVIHQLISKTRKCSLAAVSHELYGETSVFQRGNPGFFMLKES